VRRLCVARVAYALGVGVGTGLGGRPRAAAQGVDRRQLACTAIERLAHQGGGAWGQCQGRQVPLLVGGGQERVA
jgi:hypothetical protein